MLLRFANCHCFRAILAAAVSLPALAALQAARRNEAAGQRAHGEDAVTARRHQNAESKLLEAYRFLRSQFEGKPRVQPFAEVGNLSFTPDMTCSGIGNQRRAH